MSAGEFFCGGHVVCIEAVWFVDADMPEPDMPEEGKVYTILSMGCDPASDVAVVPGLYLGFAEPVGMMGGNPEFHADCFRPLDEGRLSWAWDIANGVRLPEVA